MTSRGAQRVDAINPHATPRHCICKRTATRDARVARATRDTHLTSPPSARYDLHVLSRGVAQPGLARFVRDEEAGGSNPLTPTSSLLIACSTFPSIQMQVGLIGFCYSASESTKWRIPPMVLKAIVHEAKEGGFWAEVPAIPGCATQGETLDELKANLLEAIQGCLSASISERELSSADRVIDIAV